MEEFEQLSIFEEEDNQLFGYIKWVEEFSKKEPKFNDTLNVINKYKGNEEVVKNIRNLKKLYDLIDNYCIRNYINPTPTNYGDYFVISFNAIKYKIGYYFYDKSFYYCERLSTDSIEKSINFVDIVYGIPQNNTLLIDNLLSSLKGNVESLMDLDVDIDYIQLTIDDVYLDKNNEKSLKKTK